MRRIRRSGGHARLIGLLISLAALIAFTIVPSMLEFDAEVARRSTAIPVPPAEHEADSEARLVAAVQRAATPMARAVRWIESQQRPDGSFPSSQYDRPGTTAMTCWVLLEATQEADRPSVRRALAWLREHADPARAAVRRTTYGNYDAALTLVALFHHHRLSTRGQTSPGIRRSAAADRALIERLARYCYGCADAKGWGYATDAPAGRVTTPPRPEEAGADALRDPRVVTAVEPHLRRYWDGDNSNGGYGWLGLRAAEMLGVRVMPDAFVRAEIDRMLWSRIDTGERRAVRITRRPDSHDEGYRAFWPAEAWQAEVHIGGWSYAHGPQIPAMTASTAACLAYAWQTARERGLFDEDPAAVWQPMVAAALLGGLGSLRAAALPGVFCMH